MKFSFSAVCGVLGLLASTAFAGNGSGGGGNAFGDQLNPWFLSNTPVAEYCVKVDPAFSRLSEQRVRDVVAAALDLWSKRMKHANVQFASIHDGIFIGPQQFLYSPLCRPATDVVFQMGFLTEEQKAWLPDHKQLIGYAYRTEYDKVQLRGKGLIYIAPEVGDMRPKAEGMHETPWSKDDGVALEWALLHELGHVYGLQDDFHASHSFQLMSANFVEQIVSRVTVDLGVMSMPGVRQSALNCCASIWQTGTVYATYPASKDAQEIMGFSSENNLEYRFQGTGSEVMYYQTSGRSEVFLGSLIIPRPGTYTPRNVRISPSVRMWIEPVQRVFRDLEDIEFHSYMDAWSQLTSIQIPDATFVKADGTTKKVFVTIERDHSELTIGALGSRGINLNLLDPQ